MNIGGERGAACPDSHWVYEPEASAGFHRYGVYSNVDPSFVPVGRRDRVALYVEHARRRGDRPDPAAEAALVAATVDELVARDVVRSVEVVDVSWVPTAYTWSVPGSTWAADALDVLAELGVEQVGRYARWHFQGIAESIAEGRGKAAADSLRATRVTTKAKLLPDPARNAVVPTPANLLNVGDVVLVEYTPARGTFVRVNRAVAVSGAHHDLMLAFLDHWLGDRPVSEAIKRALLAPP